MKGTRLVADKSVLSSEAWDRHINDLLYPPTKATKDFPTHDFWVKVDQQAGVRRTCNEPGLSGMLNGDTNRRIQLGIPIVLFFAFLITFFY